MGLVVTWLLLSMNDVATFCNNQLPRDLKNTEVPKLLPSD